MPRNRRQPGVLLGKPGFPLLPELQSIFAKTIGLADDVVIAYRSMESYPLPRCGVGEAQQERVRLGIPHLGACRKRLVIYGNGGRRGVQAQTDGGLRIVRRGGVEPEASAVCESFHSERFAGRRKDHRVLAFHPV